MSALSVNPPFPIFLDIDGQPLDVGYIYLGVANQATEANPIQAYWDAALTVAATQPIRTRGGFPVNAGVPARVYVNSDFSIVVKNRNGFQVFSSPTCTDRFNDAVVQVDSSDVTFLQAGTGAVTRTAQAKMRDTVSVKDFGAVGDGVADDTAAITAALTAAKHVVVPAGMTLLISSTVTVPSQTRLEFLGGTGNLNGAMPASYLIKKSTMTTVGLLISQRGMVTGGGMLCQSGNTGDGVQLIGNAAVLSDFIVVGAGRDGVLVGDSGASANANSTIVEYVKARECGRHGIYVHHDGIVGIANANAGTLLQCTAIDNTQDGIRIGHAFWVSIINCLTEINGGWGLYLSGVNNDSYPECRWPTVVGGDFNEGNVTGQVYDGSYFATFIQPDSGSVPTTATTGLQGGGFRTVLSSGAASSVQGLTVDTTVAGPASRPLTINAGSSGGNVYPALIQQITTASNGDGPGLRFRVDPATGTYRTAANLRVSQATANKDNFILSVNDSGSMLDMLGLYSNAGGVAPGADNAYTLGLSSNRWSVVYAATGTINTSDEREKQDIADLDAAEKRVAVALRGLVKKFRFKDAVQAKGDDARVHVGVIAQEVIAAFAAEGLDATRYGLLCYDQWDAGERYGVRYEELLAFIISAL
jgi:hypothetical protein